MYEQIQIGKLKPSGRNLLDWSPSRRGCVPAALALAIAWIVASPTARAVDPPPDGGYPNQNTAEGEDALFSLTTGIDNTAVGFHALFSNADGYGNTASGSEALSSNTAGIYNTANGVWALLSNTVGIDNTATGFQALQLNTSGSFNAAHGAGALYANTGGESNTASGVSALGKNTTGNHNTATGSLALLWNTTGNYNTATGDRALSNEVYANTNTGSFNTATGASALYTNTSASNNTANGVNALYSNTTGSNNTATGVDALHNSTTSNYNTADGQGSLYSNTTGRNNTASGQNALRKTTTGSYNTALGENAGYNLTTGSNNIDIGNRGVAGESKTIRVGIQGTQTVTFVAGISGATVPAGVGVIVDTNGHLGTVVSSERFKDNIQPMDKASEAILALQPVTFRYKKKLDPDGIQQFGLVAEQVEKVDPDLVARDEQGKPYTVRYEAVNAMLLNEFLKEHRKGEQQDSKIEQLEATVASLQSALKEQAAQIHMVSDQLAASQTAPQMLVKSR